MVCRTSSSSLSSPPPLFQVQQTLIKTEWLRHKDDAMETN